jgi:invasion protein IalB
MLLTECIAFLLFAVFAGSALAQTAPRPASPASHAATPDATTASFGDWILRCGRGSDVPPLQRSCELYHTVAKQGDGGSRAMIALGRLPGTKPLLVTAMVPPNVSLPAVPRVQIDGREPLSIDLAWTRCAPNACFATAVVADEVLRKMKANKDPGRLLYRDANDQEVVLAVSFRGFAEGWDAFHQGEPR